MPIMLYSDVHVSVYAYISAITVVFVLIQSKQYIQLICRSYSMNAELWTMDS